MSQTVLLAIIGIVILVHVLLGLAAHYLIPSVLAEDLPPEDEGGHGGAI